MNTNNTYSPIVYITLHHLYVNLVINDTELFSDLPTAYFSNEQLTVEFRNVASC